MGILNHSFFADVGRRTLIKVAVENLQESEENPKHTWVRKPDPRVRTAASFKPGAHDASFLAGSLAGSRAGCHAGCEAGT